MAKKQKNVSKQKSSTSPSLFGLMQRYWGIITLLIVLTIVANALSVAVPRIIAGAIDTYAAGSFSLEKIIVEFLAVSVGIFVFTYLQNIAQVLASERVARDMRSDIMAKISVQPFSYIESVTPAKLLTNLATLAIVLMGGHFVIVGAMSLGNFTAFNSYLAILIFPIMIIGFMSNVIAQAQASYGRILLVLGAPIEKKTGGLKAKLRGDIEVKNVSLNFGEKAVLKDISFSLKAGSKTAIIGPTAAGKTQLLYLLTGILPASVGEIFFDGKKLNEYDKESLHSQVGFVFQDSALFNLSLRENIAFSNTVKDENLEKAIVTAELQDFVEQLPEKLGTIVSERGTSLSGGQKQRIMLARALALDPKVLLLDDFTARVDTNTEGKILSNITKNYPKLTLISVTQKISAIEHYDQIILLMEGELLAKGTHDQLISTCPEYVQIYQSQRSTNQI